MIEPGRMGAYIALFSEIGFILLLTTLAGVGLGLWADGQLGTKPLLVLVGLFAGLGVGARAVWILIERFLAASDRK
jgi:F0F1-type ATP synthase assembly protein I